MVRYAVCEGMQDERRIIQTPTHVYVHEVGKKEHSKEANRDGEGHSSSQGVTA
jgi:hypothetical protein